VPEAQPISWRSIVYGMPVTSACRVRLWASRGGSRGGRRAGRHGLKSQILRNEGLGCSLRIGIGAGLAGVAYDPPEGSTRCFSIEFLTLPVGHQELLDIRPQLRRP
jgi:hypothetical protein